MRGEGERSEDPTTGETSGEDVVTGLQKQVESLRKRIKELEVENATLSSQLSSCRCRKSSLGLSHANGLVSRGPSFAPEEDIALTQSWLHASRDPLLAMPMPMPMPMPPKRDTLWESITDSYHSRKPNHFPLRTTKSLQCRWNSISTAIKKLQRCIRQLPIASSDFDLMTKAKILFAQTENGKKGFTLDHVWPILKDVDNWDYNPYKQNYDTSHSQSSQLETHTYPSPSSVEVNMNDQDLLVAQMPSMSSNQPTGREQEKVKRKKMGNNDHLVTNLVEHSCEDSEMIKISQVKRNECLDKLDNDCDRKLKVMMLQAENEQRRLEYDKYDKDIKIMEKDVHSITNPVQRAFFANLQAKIQAKWAHESQ